MHRAGKPSINDCATVSCEVGALRLLWAIRKFGGVLANIADFRRAALALPEASEGAHMGHPDFRARNKRRGPARRDRCRRRQPLALPGRRRPRRARATAGWL